MDWMRGGVVGKSLYQSVRRTTHLTCCPPGSRELLKLLKGGAGGSADAAGAREDTAAVGAEVLTELTCQSQTFRSRFLTHAGAGATKREPLLVELLVVVAGVASESECSVSKVRVPV